MDVEPDRDLVMTIGELSRRTGVAVKVLRQYEDLGFIYTAGRSTGNYRLFGEEALWCVQMVQVLRGLGLTLAEIQDLDAHYRGQVEPPIGPKLAQLLGVVRARTKARIAELESRLERIAGFEADHADELADRADFHSQDPCLSDTDLDRPR